VTRPLLSWEQRRQGMESGLKSGRFSYKGRGRYVWCTHCGHHGGWGMSWADDCILGHPYVCACGRVFPNKQSIAAHRRKTATPYACSGVVK
jgi:hypothetical protein